MRRTSIRSIRLRLGTAAAGLALVAACGSHDAEAEARPAAAVPAPVATATSGPAAAAPAGDTIDLRRIGYAYGPEDAAVTVIEFSDFGCPFCAMFAQGTYPELHREFVETGRVRWVFVPFVMGMFPNGAEAARAGECAAEQHRFPAMKTRIYAGQNEWKSTRDPGTVFAGYARDLGLDGDRFASCYREDRRADRIRTHNRAADALGVRATPSFVVNGRMVEGALPLEQFRTVLRRFTEGVE